MYDPHSESSCVLPNFNKYRLYHAQVGNTVCGGSGDESKYNCEMLINGQWIVSHQLLHERYTYVMWDSPEGILLMGGWKSLITTELLQDDGTSVEMFQVEYDPS